MRLLCLISDRISDISGETGNLRGDANRRGEGDLRGDADRRGEGDLRGEADLRGALTGEARVICEVTADRRGEGDLRGDATGEARVIESIASASVFVAVAVKVLETAIL